MKELKSYSLGIMYRYLLNGVAWCLAGIMGMFQGKVFGFIEAILIFVALLFTIKGEYKKYEPEDEMAEQNVSRSRSEALLLIRSLLLVVFVLAIKLMNVFDTNIDIRRLVTPVAMIIIGLGDIFVGYRFKKLEDE